MVESGKFGWALGASQNRGEFLATSGELHWDAQPTTLDNPKSGMHPDARGASQDGGEFLATSGELHWDAQPATLDNPKSGLHPDARVRFKMGVSFRRPLGSHTECGRDARVPRGDPQIWDAP